MLFNPFASSHLNQNLAKVLLKNEGEKKRCYNKRVVDVEHGSFTPLVSYGGSSPETERFIKELAEKLAKKHQSEISVVTSWPISEISFNSSYSDLQY